MSRVDTLLPVELVGRTPVDVIATPSVALAPQFATTRPAPPMAALSNLYDLSATPTVPKPLDLAMRLRWQNAL